MFCPKCGRENSDGAAFCAACGASLAGARAPAGKRNLSLAAGIIEIAFGALSLLSIIVAEILLSRPINDEEVPPFVLLLLLSATIPAILAIIGGVFALKRKSWAMALLGAIALVLTSTLPGVAALVLVIMGRDEFEPGTPSP